MTKKQLDKKSKSTAKKYYDIEQLRTQPFRYLQLKVLVDLNVYRIQLNTHVENLRAVEDDIKAEIDDYKEEQRQQEEAERLAREEQQRLHDEQIRIEGIMRKGLEDEEGEGYDYDELFPIIPIPPKLPEVILAPEADSDQEDADFEMDLSQSEEAESEENESEEVDQKNLKLNQRKFSDESF